MDAVTPRIRCINCGHEIHDEPVQVPVNERLTALAHDRCPE